MNAPRPLTAPLALAAALCAALAGCGGGGSAEPAAAAPVTPPPAPAPPPTSAGTRLTCNLPNFSADMLAAVNAHRRAGASCGTQGNFAPAADLTWNAALTQAAAAHSDDMATKNFFSHTGSDGSNAGDRATAAGYVWRSVGENIAAGQSSVTEVVDGWMKSDGHCANLMNPGFRDLGAACVAGSASTAYRSYWSQEFGSPR